MTRAYRMQEIAEGGLPRALRRTLALAGVKEDATREAGETRSRAPDLGLKPGSRLVREWGGRTHNVAVTESGFEYGGRSYRSLSAIARAITGARWSGPRFFAPTRRDR